MTSELFDTGLTIRKEVVGEQYVEQALARSTEFDQDFQTLVTEFCWGSIWGRPGLDRKTRSLLNLAMLSALNRSKELGLHVRGALRNGVTEAEISEALMQVTVYCGVPAGVEAFSVARAAIADHNAEPSS